MTDLPLNDNYPPVNRPDNRPIDDDARNRLQAENNATIALVTGPERDKLFRGDIEVAIGHLITAINRGAEQGYRVSFNLEGDPAGKMKLARLEITKVI